MGSWDAAGFAQGAALGNAFWDSFEKSRATMKDRVNKRDAKDRLAQIQKQFQDTFAPRAAMIQADQEAFQDRLLKNPNISLAEQNIFAQQSLRQVEKLTSDKLDYLSPMALDENPYIADYGKSRAQQLIEDRGRLQQTITDAFKNQTVALDAESQAGLRGKQGENLGAQTEAIPGEETREDQKVGISQQQADTAEFAAHAEARTAAANAASGRISAEAARTNAATGVQEAGVKTRESLEESVRKDNEEKNQTSDAWYKKKQIELEERKIGLQTVQGRAEILTEGVKAGLTREQLNSALKGTGTTIEEVEGRVAGLADENKKALNDREQLVQRLQKRIDEGDRSVKPKDLEYAKKQVRLYQQALDDVQLAQSRQEDASDEIESRGVHENNSWLLDLIDPTSDASPILKRQLFRDREAAREKEKAGAY